MNLFGGGGQEETGLREAGFRDWPPPRPNAQGRGPKAQREPETPPEVPPGPRWSPTPPPMVATSKAGAVAARLEAAGGSSEREGRRRGD